MQEHLPSPALRDLEGFVGSWNLELVFPFDPTTTIRGYATFEWLGGGTHLIMRTGADSVAPSGSTTVIGRDDAAENYTMLYFDERGVSRVYEMSFKDGVWKQWRSAPGFSQRSTGTFSPDGKTITVHGELSRDGSTWEPDFEFTYTRTT